MAGAYYKPCKEFDICNELIEKYWESKQYDKCFEGHLVLAEQGYPLAECQIGYFYYEGLGVEKDLEKALYWTRRAAEHGDRDGQCNLAWFYEGDHVLLKPGDMAISCYDGVHGSRSESHFPLGYYEGICLEVDPERARRWVERNAPAFRIDFSALQQNLLGDKWYRCSPAGPRCEHVFRELYESAAYLDPAFLRLKVLELLMLLCSIPRGAGTDAYCSARQAELIRHIRDHLLTDREGYTSLSRLAAEHEMSVSHLQKLFKQIYGVPVYHYIKEYRLEQAAVELVRSARPVTEIAQDAGYDNASKFSACFKERYGVTPSQYRTDAKAKQSIRTKTE